MAELERYVKSKRVFDVDVICELGMKRSTRSDETKAWKWRPLASSVAIEERNCCVDAEQIAVYVDSDFRGKGEQ